MRTLDDTHHCSKSFDLTEEEITLIACKRTGISLTIPSSRVVSVILNRKKRFEEVLVKHEELILNCDEALDILEKAGLFSKSE